MEQLRRTSHERGRARAMRAKCHRTLSPSDELLGPTKRRAHWQSAIKVSWQTQVLTTCSWYLEPSKYSSARAHLFCHPTWRRGGKG
jgi:hypothetical protein